MKRTDQETARGQIMKALTEAEAEIRERYSDDPLALLEETAIKQLSACEVYAGRAEGARWAADTLIRIYELKEKRK